MLDEIYNKRILELAANIPRLGRLEHADASATAHSKLCGSTVAVDLRIIDGRVAEFAHDVKACALGQASSSIMARHVIGSTPEELRALRDEVRRMLKENGPAPQGKWSDIAALERFILDQLTPIPGIEKIRSSFALKQVRYKTALPLERSRP